MRNQEGVASTVVQAAGGRFTQAVFVVVLVAVVVVVMITVATTVLIMSWIGQSKGSEGEAS